MSQLPLEFAEKMTIPLYKIVLAGDFGVGKTSIFQRYERNTFSKYKRATIGVDKMTKDVTVDGGQPCKVSAYTLQGSYDLGIPLRFDLNSTVVLNSGFLFWETYMYIIFQTRK